MPEMFSYIFTCLETHEKTIRDQTRFNRNLAVFAVVSSIVIGMQLKRIEKLEEDIKELKKKKGE